MWDVQPCRWRSKSESAEDFGLTLPEFTENFQEPLRLCCTVAWDDDAEKCRRGHRGEGRWEIAKPCGSDACAGPACWDMAPSSLEGRSLHGLVVLAGTAIATE